MEKALESKEIPSEDAKKVADMVDRPEVKVNQISETEDGRIKETNKHLGKKEEANDMEGEQSCEAL